jgi:hypothetical protein
LYERKSVFEPYKIRNSMLPLLAGSTLCEKAPTKKSAAMERLIEQAKKLSQSMEKELWFVVVISFATSAVYINKR